MNRQYARTGLTLIAATALSLSATLAFADDNSMSVLTGDSYAYFNNLDYNPGRFNTARAPRADERNALAAMPRKTPEVAGKSETPSARSQAGSSSPRAGDGA